MHDEDDSGIPTIACDDLDAAIALHECGHGWRLDMVMPADAPRTALLSRAGERLRLRRRDALPHARAAASEVPAITVTHARDDEAWSIGRAGMHYRDLIPGRLRGHVIASHIRIPDGGDVPDRVHFHDVCFQVIFCRKGWVRVAYEDQGPPLTMRAGDCVLQPSLIRHRVLEASPGMEVVELACPAEHPTWIDHDFALSTLRREPERSFSGQRFVHHVAECAAWQRASVNGVQFRESGIAEATAGLAGVRVLRIAAGVEWPLTSADFDLVGSGALFLYLLDGAARLHGDAWPRGDGFVGQALEPDDACTLAVGAIASIRAVRDCELLAVVLPG